MELLFEKSTFYYVDGSVRVWTLVYIFRLLLLLLLNRHLTARYTFNTLSFWWCAYAFGPFGAVTHKFKMWTESVEKRRERTKENERERKKRDLICNKHQILWLHILLGQTIFNAIACDDDARAFTLPLAFTSRSQIFIFNIFVRIEFCFLFRF